MGIEAKQQELLEELGFFQDWTERYEYVIGLGKKLAPLPAEKQTEDRLIKGCQSQVWLVTHVDLHRTPKVQAAVRIIKDTFSA